jgi:hypothetical protein
MFAYIYLLFLGTIVVVTGYHKGHNYKLNHYSNILRRSTSQDNVELSLGKSLGINEFITNYNINNRIEGVYAISDDSNAVVYVGSSSTVYKEIKEYYDQHGIQTVNSVRIQTFAQPKPELLESYKANRKIVGDSNDVDVKKKLDERADCRRQFALITDLLKAHFPISVVSHPDYEADDTIYNLIIIYHLTGFINVSAI